MKSFLSSIATPGSASHLFRSARVLRPHKAFLWLIGSTLICANYSGPVRAFDSAEHCSLANLAAELAFDFVESPKTAVTTSDGMSDEQFNRYVDLARNEFVSPKSTASADSSHYYDSCLFSNWSHSNIPFSYGQIVAMVDYTLNPADLFLVMGRTSGAPANQSELNSDYFRSNPYLSSRLDLASHNNPDHFQDHSLYLFDRWHTNAINAARSDRALVPVQATGTTEDNGVSKPDLLFRALAFNAVGDHFLEDTFAPGHVMTPRDGMYDPVALTWHDGFNSRGRVVALRHWSALRGSDNDGIYEFMLRNASRYDLAFRAIGNSPAKFKKKMSQSQVSKLFSSRTSLTAALGILSSAHEDKCRVSRHLTDRIAELDKDEFARVLDLDVDLLRTLLKKYPDGDSSDAAAEPRLCLHGDGSLDQHEHDQTIRAEISAQKAMMVLVEAQLIIDVLNEFRTGAAVAVDHRYTWCPMMHGKVGQLQGDGETPEACAYELQEASGLCRRDDDSPAGTCNDTFTAATAITPYFAYVSTPQAKNHIQYAAVDPINALYALNIGMSTYNDPPLPIVGIEFGIPVICGAENCLRDRDFSLDDERGLILYVGAETHIGNTTKVSHAFSLRASSSFLRALDLQFGPFLKLEDVGNGDSRRERFGYGVRADLGFSLVSFYLTASQEPRIYEPLRTVRSFAVGAGMSAVVNGRRIADFARGLVETVRAL